MRCSDMQTRDEFRDWRERNKVNKIKLSEKNMSDDALKLSEVLSKSSLIGHVPSEVQHHSYLYM